MERVTVGIGIAANPEILSTLEALAPRVELVHLAGLIRDEIKAAKPSPELDEALGRIEVIFCGAPPADLEQRAPRLNWLQFVGTGVDRLARAGVLGSRITVTNVTGTNALPIAEHCFLFMLMFMKRARAALANQRAHAYDRPPVRPDVLEGKTLGVLGLGAIGLETARLGKAFRMRVLATRRSARERAEAAGDVDVLYPPTELRQLLAECDFAVCALPLTPETEGIIGWPELQAMKPTAYFVNVGRGRQVNEAALVRALREGEIAGAGLDVFATEPLPESSELWGLDNVIITPHVAGDLLDNRERATRFFRANLERYLDGEPLHNVIDPQKGY